MQLTTLILIFSFCFTQMMSQDCLFLGIESVALKDQKDICLDINYSSDFEFSSLQWRIEWEAAAFDSVEVRWVDNDEIRYTDSITYNDFIQFSWFNATAPYEATQEQNLATVCFFNIKVSDEEVEIRLTELECFDIDQNQVDICTSDGIITYESESSRETKLIFNSQAKDCFEAKEGITTARAMFGSPPYVYQWEGPNNYSAFTSQIEVPTSGNYFLTVTDSAGEAKEAILFLEDATFEKIDVLINETSCAIGNDGSIALSFNEVFPPYEIHWNNGVEGLENKNLESGIYSVTIIDVNECISTKSFFVEKKFGGEEPSAIIVQPTCLSSLNGSIELIPGEGNNLPLQYLWDSAFEGSLRTNLSPGKYQVTILDALDCTTVKIFELEPIGSVTSVEIIEEQLMCSSFSEANGEAFIRTQPAEAGMQIIWSDGDTSQIFEKRKNLSSGMHVYKVENEWGCVLASGSIDIEEGMRAFEDTYYTCGLDTLEMIFEPGKDTLDYQWSPSNHFSQPQDSSTLYFNLELPDTIPEYYSAGLTIMANGGCTAYYPFRVYADDDCLWPGDTDLDNRVTTYDLLNLGVAAGNMGPSRMEQGIVWKAIPSKDWEEEIENTGIDLKHADCNGDGWVTDLDTLAISNNLGQSHYGLKEDNIYNKSIPAKLNLIIPEIVVSDSVYKIPIELGTFEEEIQQAYGLAFSLSLNSKLFSSMSANVADASWLFEGANYWSMSHTYNESHFEMTSVRNDHINQSGFGRIGNLFIAFKPQEKDTSFSIELKDIVLINAKGDPIDVEFGENSTTLSQFPLRLDEHTISEEVRIFPNPGNRYLNISTDLSWTSLELRDRLGKVVISPSPFTNQIDISNLEKGIYFLNLEGPSRFTTLKFVKY